MPGKYADEVTPEIISAFIRWIRLLMSDGTWHPYEYRTCCLNCYTGPWDKQEPDDGPWDKQEPDDDNIHTEKQRKQMKSQMKREEVKAELKQALDRLQKLSRNYKDREIV